LKEQRLLVVCDAYRNFQKDPVDCISNRFKNVFVFVRYNPISEISKYVRISSLDAHKLSSKIDLENKPSNVNLLTTPIFYLPTNSQYKKVGDRHLKLVDSNIKKNNLRFDLIHTHFTWPSGYVGAKLKEKYHVPFIVTAHGYDIYDLPFKDNYWRSKIEYVLNSADAIITVSNSNHKHIERLNVKTPVTVIPNGYKEDLFYPRDPSKCKKILNLPTERKLILSVGNLEKVKGHKYLIEAMSLVINEKKDVLCLILGGGKLESVLKRQIISAKLQDYVKLVSARSHREIPLWINACDLFVLPSLNEGNPTVMFECLGCGKPFIGTKVGGIPEIIISDNYGLLCEPANPEELAEKILSGLDYDWDPDRIKAYSSKFSWSAVSEEIYKIYSQVNDYC
jgi:glycosyltransferase involved in cell wall biosynthesis